MIETHELTKKYGDTLAVDHLTFRALPGRVTGFLVHRISHQAFWAHSNNGCGLWPGAASTA